MRKVLAVLLAAVASLSCMGALEGPTPIDVADELRASVGEDNDSLCVYDFIHEPKVLQPFPGYWLAAVTCHTLPTWRVTPEPIEWHTYHRPFDIGQNNPDPARVGNYAQILSPGTYWVEVSFSDNPYAAYGATAVKVVVAATEPADLLYSHEDAR